MVERFQNSLFLRHAHDSIIQGFDLSAIMATGIYDDAIVETIQEDSLITDTVTVKVRARFLYVGLYGSPQSVLIQDLHIGSISSRSLSFSSPFKLTATRRALKAHAFVLYFDTFFTPSGTPVAEDAEVNLDKAGEPALAEVWQVPGKSKRKDSSTSNKEKAVSFSTGPLSRPTHWK
ncbi:MAG TPA: hypothetical protein VGO47_14040, partial [Chlamydiales bacterium]|nr:hypothetical protein [Chlamydiales bacterium]